MMLTVNETMRQTMWEVQKVFGLEYINMTSNHPHHRRARNTLLYWLKIKIRISAVQIAEYFSVQVYTVYMAVKYIRNQLMKEKVMQREGVPI